MFEFNRACRNSKIIFSIEENIVNNLSWMIDVNFWKFPTALRKILGISQMIVICKGFLSYFCRCHFVHDVRFIFFMRACFSLMKRPHNFFHSFCAKIKLKIKKVHADIYFYIYVWLRCTSVIALYIYKLTTPCCPMLNLENKTKLKKGVKSGACFSRRFWRKWKLEFLMKNKERKRKFNASGLFLNYYFNLRRLSWRNKLRNMISSEYPQTFSFIAILFYYWMLIVKKPK